MQYPQESGAAPCAKAVPVAFHPSDFEAQALRRVATAAWDAYRPYSLSEQGDTVGREMVEAYQEHHVAAGLPELGGTASTAGRHLQPYAQAATVAVQPFGVRRADKAHAIAAVVAVVLAFGAVAIETEAVAAIVPGAVPALACAVVAAVRTAVDTRSGA